MVSEGAETAHHLDGTGSWYPVVYTVSEGAPRGRATRVNEVVLDMRDNSAIIPLAAEVTQLERQLQKLITAARRFLDGQRNEFTYDRTMVALQDAIATAEAHLS